MGLSRRRVLALAPVAATVAACGLSAGRPKVNIRDYGAVGDGVADDSRAISAAAAALRTGQTLYFPNGSYRYAEVKPGSGAAIAIAGVSDVAIEFARGAELVMDNLDAGRGSGHGIIVRGPASGVTITNARIRWKDQPAERSFGDGIRIVGYPAEDTAPPPDWTASRGTVTNVRILGCEVRSSPQTGVIVIGASDIRVDGLSVHDTMADGLHFNACRRAKVNNHTAVATGDDGLALVTYFSDAPAFDAKAQTFSFPELGDWSDADFTITNVKVSGGAANGVRLAGVNRVRLQWLTVTGKKSGAGIMVDSAAPGVDAGWYYASSRGLRVDRVTIADCETGIQLLARPASEDDPRFTAFDLQVSHATIRSCSLWGVRAESMTTQRAGGLRLAGCEVFADSVTAGNGGIGLANLADPRLSGVSARHPNPVMLLTVSDCTGLAADNLRFAITGTAESGPPAGPCVSVANSDGRIDLLSVRWPDAPASWLPVRIAGGGAVCAEPPTAGAVSITGLSVQPAVEEPVSAC